MRKSLKNKILIGVPAIFIAVMLVVMVVILTILNKQNRRTADTLLKNAFNIISYTISEKEKKLLFDSSQMALLNDMGGKIKSITDNKPYFKYSIMRPTYTEVASSIYNISTSAGISQASIYDMNGNLVAFAAIKENDSILGYVHNNETIEIASLKPNEKLTHESWIRQDRLPSDIKYHFGQAIPDKETARFEIIDNTLCIVAYVPVIGKDYNVTTEKMEPKQSGVVLTVQKLDTAFVKKVSELSSMEVNIFATDMMITGTRPEYRIFDLKRFTNTQGRQALAGQSLMLGDVDIANVSYFQAALPIYSDSKCIAAIVALYSKAVAKTNTVQMIKLLSMVYFAGIMLIVPITILLVVRWIITPIKRIAFMMQEMAHSKDFTQTLDIRSRDEIGDLVFSFNQMAEDLQKTTTSRDNLNQEIAERKKAENELKRLLSLHSTTLESTADGILVVDVNGHVVSYNQKFLKLWRISNSLVESRDDDKLLEYVLNQLKAPDDFLTEVKRLYSCPYESSHDILEFKDGRVYERISQPQKLGDNIIGRVWSFRDITENKKAQQIIKENESRLQTILDLVLTGLLLIDARTHKIIDVNPAAVEMIGAPKDEIVGKVCHEYVCPEELGKCPITNLGNTVDRSERMLIKADGTKIEILKSVVPTKINGQEYLIESFIDISQRKQAEQELKELNQNLEKELYEHKKTQKKLIEASRRAGMAEVATDVLHNVGNVLNSVNVSVNCIRDKIATSKAQSLKTVAAMIKEHTDDLSSFFTEDQKGKHIPTYLIEVAKLIQADQQEVVEQLRSLTKNVNHIKEIVKGQQIYAKTGGVQMLTDIREVIKDAIEINKEALTRHEVQLKLELSELPETWIDKQGLLQVLVNLISNSQYALSQSDRQEKLLTIRCHKQEDRLWIEIVDNGIGIPKENLVKIFHHGFTTKKDGHGFGLHSAAVAAKEMGGSLMAHSDGLKKGATFTLELPYKATCESGGHYT